MLAATPEALDRLHELMERFWSAVATRRGVEVPARVRYALGTALSEVVTNIIRYAQVETFDIALTLHGGGTVEARLQDRGVPFRGIPEGDLDPDEPSEGGMGLALARRALHTLDYRRTAEGVNCWSLVVLIPVGN